MNQIRPQGSEEELGGRSSAMAWAKKEEGTDEVQDEKSDPKLDRKSDPKLDQKSDRKTSSAISILSMHSTNGMSDRKSDPMPVRKSAWKSGSAMSMRSMNATLQKESQRFETSGEVCVRRHLTFIFAIFNLIIFALGGVIFVIPLLANNLVGGELAEILDIVPNSTFALYGLTAAGGCIIVIAILGIFAACQKHTGMLKCYALVIGLMFTAKLVASQVMGSHIKDHLLTAMDHYDETMTDADNFKIWAGVQQTLKCCGYNGYEDWERRSWVKQTDTQIIPLSCCRNATMILDTLPWLPWEIETKTNCTTAVDDSLFYTEGCINNVIISYVTWALYGVLAFEAVVTLIALVLALHFVKHDVIQRL